MAKIYMSSSEDDERNYYDSPNHDRNYYRRWHEDRLWYEDDRDRERYREQDRERQRDGVKPHADRQHCISPLQRLEEYMEPEATEELPKMTNEEFLEYSLSRNNILLDRLERRRNLLREIRVLEKSPKRPSRRYISPARSPLRSPQRRRWRDHDYEEERRRYGPPPSLDRENFRSPPRPKRKKDRKPASVVSSSLANSFLYEEEEVRPEDSVSAVPEKEDKDQEEDTNEGNTVKTDQSPEEEVPVDPFAAWNDCPFAEGAQQLVNDAEAVNLSEEVSPGMVKLLNTLFKNTKDLASAKKLAEQYPPPKNVSNILAPKMEEGIYKSDAVDYAVKRADKELQLTQQAILASIVAILPLLELMVNKSEKGNEFAEVGQSALDALRLAFYANTSVVRRRRHALRPGMDARVANPVIDADVSGQTLFGEEVEETVKQARKSEKLVKDLFPTQDKKQPSRGRGTKKPPTRGAIQAGRGSNQDFRQGQDSYPRGRGGNQRARGRGRRDPNDNSHHSPLENASEMKEKKGFNKKKGGK